MKSRSSRPAESEHAVHVEQVVAIEHRALRQAADLHRQRACSAAEGETPLMVMVPGDAPGAMVVALAVVA